MAEIDCNSYSLYKVPPNTIIENRKTFYGLKRRNSDSIQAWFERVRSYINHCKYPKIIEFLLVDKFMCGLNTDELESIRLVDTWSFRKLHEYLKDEQITQTNRNANVVVNNQHINSYEEILGVVVKCEFNEEDCSVETKPIVLDEPDPISLLPSIDIAEANVCNLESDEANPDGILIDGMECKVENYEYSVHDPDAIDNYNDENPSDHRLEVEQNLQRDLITNPEAGLYNCGLCQKSYSKSANLQKHIKRIHQKLPSYDCVRCKKSFKTFLAMCSHNRSVHQGIRQFACKECDKTFKSNQALRYHLISQHTGARPFGCGRCPKSYTDRCSLTKHIDAVHLKLRPHICNLCGKSFVQLSSMYLHKRNVHLGIRTHQCKECGKGFRSSTEVERHLLKHTGNKPFLCDICQQSYASYRSLKKHIEIVHLKLRLYFCDLCGKSFTRLFSMQKHKNLMHE